jgi:hypothetical protein
MSWRCGSSSTVPALEKKKKRKVFECIGCLHVNFFYVMQWIIPSIIYYLGHSFYLVRFLPVGCNSLYGKSCMKIIQMST